MSRKLFIIVCLLAAGYIMHGQNPLPPVVTSVDGKVKYSNKQKGCMKKLDSGTTLNESGRIKIKEGAALRVYYDGNFHTFKQAGKVPVSELLPAAQSGMASGFTSDFGNFLFAAAGGGDKAPPPPPPKGASGWGENDFVLIMPSGGKVAEEEVRFIWKEVKGINTFTFELFPAGSEDPILSRDVTGNSLTLNLRDSGLQSGRSYAWRVAAGGDPDRRSASTSFAYTTPTEKAQLLSQLNGMESYRDGGIVDRGLMEAFLLARGDFKADADAKYRQLLTQHPNSDLVKGAYRMFLFDNDLGQLTRDIK